MTDDCIEPPNRPNTNFLSPNKFKVIITKFPNVEFFAQSVNLPGFNMGTPVRSTNRLYDYWEIGDKVLFNDLIITLIVNEDVSAINEIKNWFTEIMTTKEDKAKCFSDITILTLTNNSNANKTFKIFNAFPFAISDILLDTKVDENNPIVMEIAFKSSHWNIT